MITKLAHVSIIVRDQQEALRFYAERLGLEKRADDSSQPGFRWLTVAPRNQSDVEIVLFKPGAYNSPEQTEDLLSLIGKQSHFVFHTDDCQAEVERLRAASVRITGEPERMPWGIQALFQDLYANEFVLLQPQIGE